MNKSRKIIELKERELEILKRRQNTIAFFRQSMVALEKDLARVQKLISSLDDSVDAVVSEKAPVVTEPVKPSKEALYPLSKALPKSSVEVKYEPEPIYLAPVESDDAIDAASMGFSVEQEPKMTNTEAKGFRAAPAEQRHAVVTSIKPNVEDKGMSSSLEDQMAQFLATA